MNDSFVSCAACGHQFPREFVLQRRQVTCSCGMRIDPASFGVNPGARHSALGLVILAIVAALLAAGYAMARRLVG